MESLQQRFEAKLQKGDLVGAAYDVVAMSGLGVPADELHANAVQVLDAARKTGNSQVLGYATRENVLGSFITAEENLRYLEAKFDVDIARNLIGAAFDVVAMSGLGVPVDELHAKAVQVLDRALETGDAQVLGYATRDRVLGGFVSSDDRQRYVPQRESFDLD